MCHDVINGAHYNSCDSSQSALTSLHPFIRENIKTFWLYFSGSTRKRSSPFNFAPPAGTLSQELSQLTSRLHGCCCCRGRCHGHSSSPRAYIAAARHINCLSTTDGSSGSDAGGFSRLRQWRHGTIGSGGSIKCSVRTVSTDRVAVDSCCSIVTAETTPRDTRHKTTGAMTFEWKTWSRLCLLSLHSSETINRCKLCF